MCLFMCDCGPYRNMLSLNNIIFAMSTSFQMNFFIDAINRIYPSVECALGGDCFCRWYISSSCSGCPPTCSIRETHTKPQNTHQYTQQNIFMYNVRVALLIPTVKRYLECEQRCRF